MPGRYQPSGPPFHSGLFGSATKQRSHEQSVHARMEPPGEGLFRLHREQHAACRALMQVVRSGRSSRERWTASPALPLFCSMWSGISARASVSTANASWSLPRFSRLIAREPRRTKPWLEHSHVGSSFSDEPPEPRNDANPCHDSRVRGWHHDPQLRRVARWATICHDQRRGYGRPPEPCGELVADTRSAGSGRSLRDSGAS
jgi:hypothetical protein